MKKFLALFIMVAGFSFAGHSQTVLGNLIQNQGSFYYLDSIGFGSEYALNSQVNLPIYVYMLNNGTETITTSDSVKIEFLLNGKSYGTLTTCPKNDWAPDSNYLVGITLPLYLSPDYTNLTEGYDNTLCSHISGIVKGTSLNAIEDEGFCGVFQINAKTNNINETEINNIAVYPNPVREMLHIDNANNINVNIYSANGQLVKSLNNVNGNVTVNTSDLNSGIYFVKMQNENATRVEKVQVIR